MIIAFVYFSLRLFFLFSSFFFCSIVYYKRFFFYFFFFFFSDPATPEIYPYCHTLSRHDALPILRPQRAVAAEQDEAGNVEIGDHDVHQHHAQIIDHPPAEPKAGPVRPEGGGEDRNGDPEEQREQQSAEAEVVEHQHPDGNQHDQQAGKGKEPGQHSLITCRGRAPPRYRRRARRAALPCRPYRLLPGPRRG